MKAEWIDNGYGVETLNVGIAAVQVYWAMDGTGYVYSYGPYKSKQRYGSIDEAKSAALTALRAKLNQAQKMIAEDEAKQ